MASSSTTKPRLTGKRSSRSAGSGAGKAAAGTPGPAALRAEVAALKKLVLFQKAKQQLLRSKTIGTDQVNSLLADYLKVVLALTGTAAGSILLHEQDQLVFRASSGPGSHRLIGKRLALDEGIAGWVCRTGKTYLSSDVSRDARWSNRISAELHFPTQNILCAPLKASDRVVGGDRDHQPRISLLEFRISYL